MNNKIIKILKNPKWIIVFLNNRGLHLLNDKNYLKMLYKLEFKKNLNLKNPKSFNEKMQWLKLYNRKDIYTTMVDKYSVKDYISNIIGSEYIIPTLGIYDKFEDIDFSKLPEQFVIKSTHYGGNNGVYIVKDKNSFNFEFVKKNLKKIIKKNLYYSGREWPYKNVKPRIIIEKYMEDSEDKSMHDYKFFCFNGEAKYILVCTDRDTDLKETFFDLNWNIMPFKRPNHEIDNSINKPKNLKLMIELANKLSKDIPFLRVDFYEINGKVYFGELTFYPASGFGKFIPKEGDYKLGDMINL